MRGSLRMTGLFRIRAELPDLESGANTEKRHAADISSTADLMSSVAARQANDHEGLVALLHY
jgi:hypothetical protein